MPAGFLFIKKSLSNKNCVIQSLSITSKAE